MITVDIMEQHDLWELYMQCVDGVLDSMKQHGVKYGMTNDDRLAYHNQIQGVLNVAIHDSRVNTETYTDILEYAMGMQDVVWDWTPTVRKR